MVVNEERVKTMPYSILIAGWLLTSQASAVADHGAAPAEQQSTKPPAQRAAPVEVATHATTGVVKTVSATTLVITRRTAGKRTDTSFVLTPTTQKEGTLAAGSTVEIRYRTDGKQRIATAVSVEDAPQ